MKYRSISLNGTKLYQYSLVKLDKTDNNPLEELRTKHYLTELRKINKRLADYVENGPKIYSELSEHQSYMIFCGNNKCVGAINIEPSTDEKNLEIELQFDEKHFKSQEEMLEVLEQVVESLKLYFYDKENIEIKLNHNIDLSKIDPFKYQKKVYDENLTTYMCSNEQNNILIPRLINEITETEKCLNDWRLYWNQTLELVSYYDIHSDFDRELIKEIDNGTITLAELFYKVQSMALTNITSINSYRNIDFSRDGQVVFSKKSRRYDGINYDFNYNVLFNDFHFNGFRYKIRNDSKENIEIEENEQFTNMKFVDINSRILEIMHTKENKRKKITYTSPVVDNSSILVELWSNEQDEIERCYIDFRTHKKNGKVNGVHALRLFAQHNIFSLNYISRNGDKCSDFLQVLANDEEELHSAIIEGKITMEIIDELVKKIIPIINRKITERNSNETNKKYIAEANDVIIPNILELKNQAINFIKQIKGEIPLPHLQEIIEKFIEANDINKKDDNQKTLKK